MTKFNGHKNRKRSIKFRPDGRCRRGCENAKHSRGGKKNSNEMRRDHFKGMRFGAKKTGVLRKKKRVAIWIRERRVGGK